jgi:outer membrane protein
MRSALLGLGLCSVLLAASPAWAQFANRSIGFSAGYQKLNEESGLNWGVPAGILYTAYLDAGFEATGHFHVMFLQDPVLRKTVVGVTPQIGIRYLFLQEHVRPYVALDLSYLHLFYDTGGNQAASTNYVGVGPNLGIDFFVSDTWSVGVRGQYNLYVMLNKPTQSSLGATLEVATYY